MQKTFIYKLINAKFVDFTVTFERFEKSLKCHLSKYVFYYIFKFHHMLPFNFCAPG